MSSAATQKLLGYYRDVEFFRAFDYSRLVLDNPKSISIYRNSSEEILPWNNVSKYKLDPEYEYAFDFFLTPFSVENALRTVATLIPGIDKAPSELSHVELPGLSCVARIEIRKNIGINFEEVSLSTFPWALTELAAGSRLSLNSFETSAEIWMAELGNFSTPKEDEQLEKQENYPNKLPGAYPNIKDLNSFASVSGKDLKFDVCPSGLLGSIIVRRGRKLKSATLDTEVAPPQRIKRKVEILNSFYLRDLERVASGEVSSSLSTFLSEKKNKTRVDYRVSSAEKELFISELTKFKSQSSWPFPAGVKLSPEQTLAIKWLLNDLPKNSPFVTPIIAVNGPPGTGKSLLVKQILAELIVKRALILAKLRQPRDAFIESERKSIRLGNLELSFRPLRPELTSLGLLIVSNNNGAVENLTRELPRKDRLPQEMTQLTYLESVAKRYEAICGAELNWWGLPSVALGKRSNRILFRYSLDKLRSTDENEEPLPGLSLIEYRREAPPTAKSFHKLQKLFLEAYEQSEPNENNTHSEGKVFNLALLLCEAWIRETPGFESEIKAICQLLSRPKAFSPEEGRELWNILFMIAPAISTTLASVERMLAGLAPSSIPYLIVEEAGQASPQSVLGALLRSNKALFIGDQRQLEPISNITEPLDRYLRKNLLSSPHTSAQSVADNLSPIGTFIREANSEHIWVGLPLLEHRRCDEPMFSLSNEIAYGGMMKSFVTNRPDYPLSIESCWIQVAGNCSDKHWVPEQRLVLEKLLARIYAEILDPDLFIITPFRSVRNNAAAVLKDLDAVLFSPESGRPSLGTIHAFQGKEADTVILLLGCDHTKIPAADWAGEKPNLLNVAITRAKRRFFVIGDRNVWHGRGYFSDLVHGLEWRSIE